MPEEQRKTERSKVFLIAEFSPVHKRSAKAIGITNSFSTAGISIEAQSHDLRLGEMLEISLKHPQMDEAVTIRGKIVWKRSGWYKYAFGVEFTESDPETINMLLELEERLKHISPDIPLYNDKTIDTIQDAHPSSAVGKDIEEALRAAEDDMAGAGDEVSSSVPTGAEDKTGDSEEREPRSRVDSAASDITAQTKAVIPEADKPPAGESGPVAPRRAVSRRIRRRSPALAVTAILVLSIAILFALPDEVTHLNGVLDRLRTTEAPGETARSADGTVEPEHDLIAGSLPEDNPPVAPESAVPFELPESPVDIKKSLSTDKAVSDNGIIQKGDAGTPGTLAAKGEVASPQGTAMKRDLPVVNKPVQKKPVEKAAPDRQDRRVAQTEKTIVGRRKPERDAAKTEGITKKAAAGKTDTVKPAQKIVKRKLRKPLPPKKKVVRTTASAEKKIDKKIGTAVIKKDAGKTQAQRSQASDKQRMVASKAVKKQPEPDKTKPVKVTVKETLAPGVAMLGDESAKVDSGKSPEEKVLPDKKKPAVDESLPVVNKPKPPEETGRTPAVVKKRRPVPKIALVIRRRPRVESGTDGASARKDWKKIGTTQRGFALFYDALSMRKKSPFIYEVTIMTSKDREKYEDRLMVDCLNRKILRSGLKTGSPLLSWIDMKWQYFPPDGAAGLITDHICMLKK
jgi:hypothetical protein